MMEQGMRRQADLAIVLVLKRVDRFLPDVSLLMTCDDGIVFSHIARHFYYSHFHSQIPALLLDVANSLTAKSDGAI